MTANWYSTDDTSTSTNSSSSEQRIENQSRDADSDSVSEPPKIDFSSIIIDSTTGFIEKLEKRWWNFIDCILDGTGNPAKTPTGTAGHRDEVIPLAPHFTGLRIALGGDKHTH